MSTFLITIRLHESLGELIEKTNRQARAHIIALSTKGRCSRVMERFSRDVPLDSNTSKPETVRGFGFSSLDRTQKAYSDYWDVIGMDGQDVILRRKLSNGVNEEFVLQKDEMENKGLIGLRAGRKIEVWKDPETGEIVYKLQRCTKLKMTPLLQSILDAEKNVTEDVAQILNVGEGGECPQNTLDELAEEQREIEHSETVTIIGSNGKEEIITVSKSNGDLWVCVDTTVESRPDDFLIRSAFGGPEMLVNNQKLLSRLKGADFERGSRILIRFGLNSTPQYDLVQSSYFTFSKDFMGKYGGDLKQYLNPGTK